jgi:hypothetical protein
MRDLHAEWFRPMSLDKLMKKANKPIAHVQKLNNKYESRKRAYQSRSKSIPKNATIIKENVKCKKPNCYCGRHGPYYYAYWKDPETKRLRKKYIGRHFEGENISANMEHAETSTPIESQSKSEQQDKKKKKVLVTT